MSPAPKAPSVPGGAPAGGAAGMYGGVQPAPGGGRELAGHAQPRLRRRHAGHHVLCCGFYAVRELAVQPVDFHTAADMADILADPQHKGQCSLDAKGHLVLN